jgi:nucleoside-diphosphate-sugar epimerase
VSLNEKDHQGKDFYTMVYCGNNMENVLVTGVTGFLGSHLLASLQKNGRHHLVGMIRNPRDQQRLENLGVEVRVADLLQPLSLQNITRDIDTVIHLAARMRFHDPWDILYAHNVEGTKHLALDAARTHVSHFIYISSTEAMGPVDTVPGDESAPYHPAYGYGKSKMLAEQWLREQQGRLPVTILRPTGVCGPGDPYVTMPVLRAVQRGLLRAIPKKAAEHYIQFTYVTDVVQGIIAALENPKKAVGGTFILASDDYYSYRELFTLLARLLHAPPPRYSVPSWLVWAVLRYLEWTNRRKGIDEFVFHASLVDDMKVDRAYSNAKAKRVLGFFPQYTLQQGISEILSEHSFIKN